jgi:hypothetical protein
MAKFKALPKSDTELPEAMDMPEKKTSGKAVMGNKPERGERTEKNKATKGARHPGSHDEFEALGRD